MRSKIEDYNAVVEAASKFTKSVAEGNSKYAKELFTEDACLFGFLNANVAVRERGGKPFASHFFRNRSRNRSHFSQPFPIISIRRASFAFFLYFCA